MVVGQPLGKILCSVPICRYSIVSVQFPSLICSGSLCTVLALPCSACFAYGIVKLLFYATDSVSPSSVIFL
jgi:hypothetical protein